METEKMRFVRTKILKPHLSIHKTQHMLQSSDVFVPRFSKAYTLLSLYPKRDYFYHSLPLLKVRENLSEVLDANLQGINIAVTHNGFEVFYFNTCPEHKISFLDQEITWTGDHFSHQPSIFKSKTKNSISIAAFRKVCNAAQLPGLIKDGTTLKYFSRPIAEIWPGERFIIKAVPLPEFRNKATYFVNTGPVSLTLYNRVIAAVYPMEYLPNFSCKYNVDPDKEFFPHRKAS